MLFLLRTFRHKLMSANKVTTYILYAIGEIFLVVIGILIAVSIDNWNEKRQTKQLEIRYLKELRDNLTYDINDIDFNIQFNQSVYQSNHIILNHLRKQLPYHDSLDFHLSNLVFSTRSIPNTSAYESLKSRGLEIISNDSLRGQITTVYSVDFTNVIDFEHADDHAYQYQVFWPKVIQSIEIDSVAKSAKPIDYITLMNDVAFKNALNANRTYRGVMLGYYEGLRKKVIRLIAHIESELERLQNN